MGKIHLLPPMTAPALDDVFPADDISTTNDDTKQVTLAQVLSLVYPVGSIYCNGNVSTNPATLLGFGTWTAIAGRVLVGLDSGQTEFDTLLETGGAKTHTLQTSEMPSHNHTVPLFGTGVGGSNPSTGPGGATGIQYPTSNTGGGGAHNNLQPYIVVYMWRRTA